MKTRINITAGFNSFRNMKLAYKFFAIAMIVITGFITVGYAFYLLEKNLADIALQNDEADQFNKLVNDLAGELGEARHHYQDFLLANKNSHIDKNKKLLSSGREHLVKLKVLLHDEENEGIVVTLIEAVEHFHASFQAMAEEHRNLGFDHNSGLHGKLRAAVHDLEEILKTHDQINLSNSMLMMRRHEKNYMARKSGKYIEKMAVEIEIFNGLLEKSGLPSADKETVTTHLNKYHQTFLELPPIYKSIKQYLEYVTNAADMTDMILTDLHVTRDKLLADNTVYSQETTARFSQNLYIVIACALIMSILLLLLVGRIVSRSIKTASVIADSIAAGNLDNHIAAKSTDETGQLLLALHTMQSNLRERIDADRQLAAVNGRIRQALDNVNGNVMIADVDFNIIYMNDAVIAMMRNAETDLRTELPDFDVDRLMGASINFFYKDSAQKPQLLEKLTSAYTDDLQVGGRHFRVITNPVFGADEERLGTVVEWTDRTQEAAVEQEIQGMVDSALAGDLSRRIDLAGKEGFFEMLSQGVNDLVDVSERVLNDTVRVLGAMAQGNLTRSIDSDYQGSFGQLKNDTNSTIAKLTEVIGAIRINANSVLNGSREISEGNVNLSQRTEEQASSLEETASSMKQMTVTVRQNADNARQADQLASGARKQAEKGGYVVGNAIAAMGEITSSSRKIADIISVIDEIAFQTNLLALNAAVEAARAGEQGRGFAVVASEVRNLAGRSATAAKEIKDLIKDSVAKVEEGSKLVDESGKTLEEIVGSVKQVSDIIAEIALAGQEQSSGIEQVNRAIFEMDKMTQQNAALVEQAAAASKSMGEQAHDLDQLVSFFTTCDNTSLPTGERRSEERPWSDNPAEAAPAPKARAEPAKAVCGSSTSDDDSVWGEF